MEQDFDEKVPEIDDTELTQRQIDTLTEQVKRYQDEITVASQNSDPETLSNGLLKLARINSALGRQAAYAKYLARNADRSARRFRAKQTLDYSKSAAVNKSELQAELDAKTGFRVASEAQLIADQADDLCFRTDTFLKLAQSRLSLIKNDAKRA
ncbi:MAG TPA: hypothetical protein VFL85_01650 [Candidatus Saccharimonadales bacterium]|nr:hypothetical protein [Candidatus Saccharimonadales bacterium]